MSGIIGFVSCNHHRIDPAVFQQMVDILAHRGPDGSNTWIAEDVALGHQMLQATPESVYEVLPCTNADKSLFLTADARVDNRNELMQQLHIRQAPGQVVTDADLILAAYQKWGEGCADRIIGAFAFAIWDAVKKCLYCARDHYGLKPFYFSHIEHAFFAFASEAKSVLQVPGVPRELNEVAVAEHLLAPVQGDASITFYKHVHRLEPGHFMTLDINGLRIKRYWMLDPERELKLGSDAEYAEVLRETFVEAVRCRLRTHKPVGAMLSGGMDSSSIVSVAAPLCAARKETLHTFSAVYNKISTCDERNYIQHVLDKYGENLKPHYMHADEVSPLDDHERVLWHQDSALFAGNLYINWTLYNKAKQEGVRVIMEGFDGDTTVSHGSGYLHELAHKGKWFSLLSEVKSEKLIGNDTWKEKMWWWVKKYKIEPAKNNTLLQPIRKAKQRLRRRAGDVPAMYAPSLGWQTVINSDFQSRFSTHIAAKSSYPKTEREDHYRLLMRPLMSRVLELCESSAAAAGLDLRQPFCDRRMIELCLSLPATQKRRKGWTRFAMRNAMQNILPTEIQHRPSKGDLGPGFDHGLLVLEADQLSTLKTKDPGGVGRFVNLDVLRQQYPRFDQNRSDNNTLYHWRALSLALWLQHTGL